MVYNRTYYYIDSTGLVRNKLQIMNGMWRVNLTCLHSENPHNLSLSLNVITAKEFARVR